MGELNGELISIHLSLIGDIRFGLMQLVDEVIDRRLPVSDSITTESRGQSE